MLGIHLLSQKTHVLINVAEHEIGGSVNIRHFQGSPVHEKYRFNCFKGIRFRPGMAKFQ